MKIIWNGYGLPPVGSVVLRDGRDVKIKAHTFVANKPAAIFQSYDQFGYGLEGEFEIDPDQQDDIEGRTKFSEQLEKDIRLHGNYLPECTCDLLFDLGYRKIPE